MSAQTFSNARPWLSWRALAGLAWRNLWRNRRRSLITTGMVAIGFALAILSIGIGDGAHNQMIRNGIRYGNGHVSLLPEGYLSDPSNHRYLGAGEALLNLPALGGVQGQVAPRIFLQALASSAYNAIGVGLQGLDLGRDPLAVSLQGKLTEGHWLEAGDHKGVVIGSGIAEKLKLRVGSKLVLMTGGRKGEVINRLGRVRGIIDSGMDDLDHFLILASLEFSRALLPGHDRQIHASALTRLAIFLDDPADGPHLIAALQAGGLPTGVVAASWQQMMPELVNFVILDDFGNYVWLGILAVVVVFGILNTMLMSVLDRVHEFGLVRALGLRPGELLRLVLLETLLLALVATVLGWMLGGAAHVYFSVVGLDLTSLGEDALKTAGSTMDPILRSELSGGRILVLTLLVLGTTMASGLYPALRAMRVSPLEALRH